MRIKRVEDMIAWRHARELERRVFAFTGKAPANRDWNYCDQIRRSAASAARNIAEGFGRFWPGEFAHKLHIAVGELRETQDHLEKALEQKYVTDDDQLEMFGLADGAIGAAVKFIEYLEAAGPDWKKQFLLRRRAAYRAHRTGGTADPTENGSSQPPPARMPDTIIPRTKPRIPESSPPQARAVNKRANSTENANVNANPNRNENQNQHQNRNPNENPNENRER